MTNHPAWLRSLWNEWLKPLALVLAILTPVRSAIGDWNDVPTGSMKPTILEGDRVVVNKIAYDLKIPFTRVHLLKWDNPQRGDIVVLDSPLDGKRLVKRVVGLPGDVVEMRQNVVVLNGEPLRYSHLDAERARDVRPEERAVSLFAVEHLGKRPHPVMATPSVPASRAFDSLEIPPGHYFVMGDNRDNSFDSRGFGLVERRHIVGEAVAVAFSFDRTRSYRPRFGRFFSALS